jgi:hypothetical protein
MARLWRRAVASTFEITNTTLEETSQSRFGCLQVSDRCGWDAPVLGSTGAVDVEWQLAVMSKLMAALVLLHVASPLTTVAAAAAVPCTVPQALQQTALTALT